MKLDRAAVYVSDLLGREVSRETIRRYEVEKEAPRTIDPVLVAALARVYGHDPSELPPEIVAGLERLAAVVSIGRVIDATRVYITGSRILRSVSAGQRPYGTSEQSLSARAA